MFRTESLQIKLIGAFILMGAIVFVVALVGWLGNYRMNQHVKTFSEDTLPTIIGLWQIHECQTQIESYQILLENPILPPEERTEYLQRMNQAMQKIEIGFQRYKQTKLTEDEADLSNQLNAEWANWLQIHKQWMDLEEKFTQNGLRNPWDKKAFLLSQGQGNSQEMQVVNRAIQWRE